MARPLRIEYAGALYHVTSRGNERRRIFLDEHDYGRRWDWLKRTVYSAAKWPFGANS